MLSVKHYGFFHLKASIRFGFIALFLYSFYIKINLFMKKFNLATASKYNYVEIYIQQYRNAFG